MIIWQARTPHAFCEWSILTTIWLMKTKMKTLMKRISVDKSGPTTAPVGSQSKNLTTCQLICAQVVLQKQLCSLLCGVLSRGFPTICRLREPFSAARDSIWIARGNSTIVGRSVSTRGTVQPSTAKWILQLPPEYNLTLTVMEISVN